MIDADGIYDRCGECGAFAEARHRYFFAQPYRVGCTECANTTDWCWSETAAMVRWNREQRAMKARAV